MSSHGSAGSLLETGSTFTQSWVQPEQKGRPARILTVLSEVLGCHLLLDRVKTIDVRDAASLQGKLSFPILKRGCVLRS